MGFQSLTVLGHTFQKQIGSGWETENMIYWCSLNVWKKVTLTLYLFILFQQHNMGGWSAVFYLSNACTASPTPAWVQCRPTVMTLNETFNTILLVIGLWLVQLALLYQSIAPIVQRCVVFCSASFYTGIIF